MGGINRGHATGAMAASVQRIAALVGILQSRCRHPVSPGAADLRGSCLSLPKMAARCSELSEAPRTERQFDAVNERTESLTSAQFFRRRCDAQRGSTRQQSGNLLAQAACTRSRRWHDAAGSQALNALAIVELVECKGQDQLRHAYAQCLSCGSNAPWWTNRSTLGNSTSNGA